MTKLLCSFCSYEATIGSKSEEKTVSATLTEQPLILRDELYGQWLVLTSQGMTTFADLSVAALLCFYLLKSRNTYYKGCASLLMPISSKELSVVRVYRTRAIIRTLVQYTIPTGLLAT